MKRLTQKDIALRAGVTVSCVSQALRDLPGIGIKTKRRIQRLAKEMGYRPDPALGALVAYRSGVKPAGFRSVLAFVAEPSTLAGPDPKLSTARTQAAALGYELDVFSLKSPRDDWRQVLKVIRARGIRGILLAPRSTYTETFPRTSLDDLCLATVGYSVNLPGIHRVSPNQYLDLLNHLTQLKKLGYRRIGLWVPPEADGRVNYQFSAGYLAGTQALKLPAAPIHTDACSEAAAIKDWVRSNQLDACIGLPSHLPQLQNAGFQIPEALGFSTFDWHGGQEVQTMSGFDYRPARLISGAIDLLHSLLLHNRTGLSTDYPLTLYNGRFVHGPTTRRL